jgi:hypothetical protein
LSPDSHPDCRAAGVSDPEAQVSWRYRGNSLMRETRIEITKGTATVTGFMPLGIESSDVVRIIEGKRGIATIRAGQIICLDYGSLVR